MSLIAERSKISVKASPGPRMTGPQYELIGGRLISIPDSGQSYIDNGYNINDIVYSIIKLIMDKVEVAPWSVYQVKDESSLKSMHAIQRKNLMTPEDYRRAKDLSIKALEPVRNPGKIGELLKFPNEYDVFNSFVANGCGYKLLTGNKCIWGDMLQIGANKGFPNTIHNMPSQHIQMLVKSGFPGGVLGYQISSLAAGSNVGYTKEEVLHEKYMNFNWSVNGVQWWGMAPLKAALSLTNRNNSALQASTAKFQNGGISAIVYIDDDRVPAGTSLAQAAATKRALINEYTGPDNWGKIVSVPYRTGVANLGLSPVELDIIQAEKWDMRRFCNVFGVPSQLMNDPDHKSYNTSKEGEKALTNRCALPLLTSFRDNFNRKLHTDWGLKNRRDWIVDFDMTVYSELQQDVKEMMEWLKPLMENGFPLNRVLELLNIETIDDPLFNEPWVRQTMGVPMSEWKLGEVDNAINNGDGEAE